MSIYNNSIVTVGCGDLLFLLYVGHFDGIWGFLSFNGPCTVLLAKVVLPWKGT